MRVHWHYRWCDHTCTGSDLQSHGNHVMMKRIVMDPIVAVKIRPFLVSGAISLRPSDFSLDADRTDSKKVCITATILVLQSLLPSSISSPSNECMRLKGSRTKQSIRSETNNRKTKHGRHPHIPLPDIDVHYDLAAADRRWCRRWEMPRAAVFSTGLRELRQLRRGLARLGRAWQGWAGLGLVGPRAASLGALKVLIVIDPHRRKDRWTKHGERISGHVSIHQSTRSPLK